MRLPSVALVILLLAVNVYAQLMTTHISESSELQFRAEFFNILSHPNFNVLNAEILGPSFGAISTMASPERQIQAGVKLGF